MEGAVLEAGRREDLEVEEKEVTHLQEGGRWSSKLDFFMASISATIGLGNLWRFPYIVYRNGGGAFLIPFVIMMTFVGYPLITMELALGQYSRHGAVGVWKLCPLFTGIGWTMVLMNFICNTYYTMLMAYSILYTAASFTNSLPWTRCNNSWNTNSCVDGEVTCIGAGGMWLNESGSCFQPQADTNYSTTHVFPPLTAPSEEYFNNYVLGLSTGITDVGEVRWHIALCLLLAWILIIAGLSLGTKSWGKVSYLTAVLPYVVMFALLIQAATLEGSYDGIIYYLKPRWDILGSAQVWVDAAVQVFFSTGCGWGNFITIAKHNNFHDNCLRDAGLLVLGDLLTSLLCGFVIFTILGQMAFQLSKPISEVVTSGPGLAFIVYPEAASRMPGAPFWAVFFFIMLINLGLGSAIPQVANIVVSVCESFPTYLSGRTGRMLILLSLSAGTYLLGLLYATNGGMYFLTLVDKYGPSYTLLVTGLVEVIVVAWIYGSENLQRNIMEMTGRWPGVFFTACWRLIAPGLILFIFVFVLVDWSPLHLDLYQFPVGSELVGLGLTLLQVLIIPAFAIYKIISQKLNKKALRDLVRPSKDWGREYTAAP